MGSNPTVGVKVVVSTLYTWKVRISMQVNFLEWRNSVYEVIVA